MRFLSVDASSVKCKGYHRHHNVTNRSKLVSGQERKWEGEKELVYVLRSAYLSRFSGVVFTRAHSMHVCLPRLADGFSLSLTTTRCTDIICSLLSLSQAWQMFTKWVLLQIRYVIIKRIRPHGSERDTVDSRSSLLVLCMVRVVLLALMVPQKRYLIFKVIFTFI